jgi:hypothetical protein
MRLHDGAGGAVRLLIGLLGFIACNSGSAGSHDAGGDVAAPGAGGKATTGAGGADAAGGAGAATGAGGGVVGAGGAAPGTGGAAAGGAAGTGGAAAPPCAQVMALVTAYKAAHPGNGGKDWDINAKTAAQIAADPAAQQLLALCGPNQRPVIPLIAWEYGGSDHQWINPQASALIYCVYTPVSPATSDWQYDAAQDHVTADVYVQCPDQNPCNSQQGANQIASCIGDVTNFEILVDTASLDDGAGAGLALANASTELMLILTDGSKVHLYSNL